MKMINSSKWSALFCAFLFITMVACDSDDLGIDGDGNEGSHVVEGTQDGFFAVRADNEESGNEDTYDFDSDEVWDEVCFEFVYPVQVKFPNGDVNEYASEEELETAIEGWVSANPEAEDFPNFAFPLQVVFGDGEIATAQNDEELCDFYFECVDEDIEDLLCFDFVFPLSIIMPDGSTLDVNSDEELWTGLDAWYEANPEVEADPELVYPIGVLVDGDVAMNIENEEQFEELLDDCGFDEYEPCFNLNYPVVVILPDGSSFEATSEEMEWETVAKWFESNPEVEGELTYEFPINVTFEDGSTGTANNDKELCDLYESCYEGV